MDKKTVLAVVLAALILFGYQFYIAKFYPGAYTVTSPEPGASERMEESRPQEIAGLDTPRETIAESGPIAVPEVPAKKVVFETEKYVVTLSNEGGCIKSIVLKEYPHPGTNEVFKLVDIESPAEAVFNMDGMDEYNLPHVRFAVDEKRNEVVFSTQLKSGLNLTKRYIFHDDSYHIDLEAYFNNPTTQVIYPSYSIVAGSNVYIATKLDRRYAQIVSDISGKARRDNGKKGEGVFAAGAVNYSGLQNKYFSVITKPSVPAKGVWLRQTANDNLLSKIEIDKFAVNPGTTVYHNFLLYAGPTIKKAMEPYGLKAAISYGFFGGISEVLLAGLALFQRIFRNWGVAIILLSALVNLILFPLSRKSYESMKKMQEIQPHMEKLRNEHKDNPHKLNKEMMELYKKYNVNPMGGCLPLFLQIPVFISLYQALMRSLDLRGAGFLWIRDLSMPDAVRLPFSMPALGNSINILPILMAGAMVFQQKIAAQKGSAASAQAKQQQQMMVLMPVLFLFIMYNFPSGLVLYWLTNTLLTMFEQRAIMHS